MTAPAPGQPLAPRVISAGLIGAGRMGSFPAETLARRLPGTRLAAIADPAPGAAQQLADGLGGGLRALTDPGQLLAGPAVTGQDARAALAVARAAIQSVTTGGPVRIDELKDE
jgi:predicted dehydrogenase